MSFMFKECPYLLLTTTALPTLEDDDNEFIPIPKNSEEKDVRTSTKPPFGWQQYGWGADVGNLFARIMDHIRDFVGTVLVRASGQNVWIEMKNSFDIKVNKTDDENHIENECCMRSYVFEDHALFDEKAKLIT
ncbi:hypothetical protein NECAME_17232 [Necator americanus]|uniref:Uncharacterized protein n=1 Tax=Necator americanus TaxID=51031 RepID=W2TR34_NECAM|nr:hypothetical protein NECAME_17232 [Necator americanus]ETN84134.1 hypothetical protein NECAME_17232 [Necator americanus]